MLRCALSRVSIGRAALASRCLCRTLAGNGAAVSLPARGSAADFNVFNFSRNGLYRRETVSVASVLAHSKLHARDVMALGPDQGWRKQAPSIMPRDGAIVVTVAHLKAIVHHDHVLLFNCDTASVRHSAKLLSAFLKKEWARDVQARTRPRQPHLAGDGGEGVDGSSAGTDGLPRRGTAEMTALRRQQWKQHHGGAGGHPGAPIPVSVPRGRRTPLTPVAAPLSLDGGGGGGHGGGGGGGGHSGDGGSSTSGTDDQGFVPYAQHMTAQVAEEDGLAYLKLSTFELNVLECLLRDVCQLYAQRVSLFQPVVSTVLNELMGESIAHDQLQRLLPLQDGLSTFELAARDAMACLKTLIENDEDMRGLLLTAQLEKATTGRWPRPGLSSNANVTDQVELLLEAYHRQMSEIYSQVFFLRKKVESTKELAQISLDNYRNNLIRINLHLTMGGVGLALATTVAGLFGMNLVSGLEEHPAAFAVTCAVSGALGASVYFGTWAHLVSTTKEGMGRGPHRAQALQAVFQNVDDVQSVLMRCARTEGKLTRNNLAARLAEEDLALPQLFLDGNSAPGDVADLVLDVWDTSGDGVVKLGAELDISILEQYSAIDDEERFASSVISDPGKLNGQE